MPSLEELKKVAEELKRTGAKELKKEDLGKENTIEGPEEPPPEEGVYGAGPVIQKEEIKNDRDDLLHLTQERLKLEKILQEINNLKGRICQRIELIKTLERGKKEIERTPNFLEEVKNKLDNLREHIKPR